MNEQEFNQYIKSLNMCAVDTQKLEKAVRELENDLEFQQSLMSTAFKISLHEEMQTQKISTQELSEKSGIPLEEMEKILDVAVLLHVDLDVLAKIAIALGKIIEIRIT